MMDYYDKHKGETCLLVGNGPNLLNTPPEWFDFPSFGMNTIYMYQGEWEPTYYVASDYCYRDPTGENVFARFASVPKFVPSPVGDRWQGDTVTHIPKKSGDIRLPRRDRVLVEGYASHCSMNSAMIIAWHMGFTRMLMIGVEQKPGRGGLIPHFWGDNPATHIAQTDEHWNLGYKDIIRAMNTVEVLNISEGTYVPETILPRDDWKRYASGYTLAGVIA